MIDYDVHNEWGNAQVPKPYLDLLFRDYLERDELPGWEGIHPEGFIHSDVTPANREKASSELTIKKAIWVSTLAHYLVPRRGVTSGAR